MRDKLIEKRDSILSEMIEFQNDENTIDNIGSDIYWNVINKMMEEINSLNDDIQKLDNDGGDICTSTDRR